MILSRLFLSSAVPIALCLVMYFVLGGSLLMWILTGWLLSAPFILFILVIEHSDRFKKWQADRNRSQTAPDRRPVTNKSTVFKKI